MLLRIIVAIDDAQVRSRVERLLAQAHVHVLASSSIEQVRGRLTGSSFDLAIIEGLEPNPAGLTLLRTIAELPDAPRVIALGRGDSAEEVADLLAVGVVAVVNPDLDAAVLGASLGTLIERRRHERVEQLSARPRRGSHDPEFVSASPKIRTVVETARRIAHADSPVLLLGETGVGKERLARMIHADSSRAPGAFIAVNCAAIPGELFESELFGHEKGAFTGASRSRRGQFELAHGGTLFLDEVGEVPVHLQAKLLRALQERKVKPVGSNHAVEIDVRVISATNRDLAEEMTEGRFRRDLYYRLSVVELTIPPLRERAEDIRVMTDAFVRALAAQLGRQVEGFDPPALHALEHYDWPGNVRELVNVIERAVLLCDAPRIGLGDLPEAVTRCASEELAPPVSPLGSGPDVVSVPPAWAAQTWKHVREELLLAGERAYLCAVLAAAEGRVGLAASRAGLSPRALFEKMRRHGLRKEDFRPTRPSAS